MKLMEVMRLAKEFRRHGYSFKEIAGLFNTDAATARRLVGKGYSRAYHAKYMNPVEAARLLGCGVKRIRGLVRRGELTASNISEHPTRPRLIISRESLVEFLKRREVKTAQPVVRRQRRIATKSQRFTPG